MKITISGKEFTYLLNERTGMFSTVIDGEDVERETLAKLKDVMTASCKKKDVAVPFLVARDNWYRDKNVEIQSGIATSIHSGNGNIIAKLGGGPPQQLSSHHWSNYLKPDTDTEQLKALWQTQISAREAYEKFLGDNKIDLKAEIEAALTL